MNPIRIFFDTNVLVYAHDESSTYHVDSAQLLALVFQNKLQGIVAEQNIIELYRILTNSVAMSGKALTPSQAKSLIDSTYLAGTFEIVYPSSSTLHKVLDLAAARNIASARVFDLRLAALVLETDVDSFATYNVRDFLYISDLPTLTPDRILKVVSDRE
jgi:predicted nucleic acid-binding protein